MGRDVVISVQSLTKVFEKGDMEVIAIQNLNIDVFENEFFCIVGPNGCGKTTLLRTIAGLEKPSNGKVLLNGKEIKSPGADRSMVFQEFALFPWRSVKKNIEFGLEIKGLQEEKKKDIVSHLVGLVNLKGFEDSHPRELSSGMKQRVAIARALAHDPKLLLMDEPLGSLDAQTRNIMQKELLRIWDKTKKTIIFVTHSVDEAVFLADRIAVLTSRPGSLKTIFEINIPHPRDRTSVELVQIRGKILKELEVEVEKSLYSP
jgi:NitT/TauT family transport system ATP-binding protein